LAEGSEGCCYGCIRVNLEHYNFIYLSSLGSITEDVGNGEEKEKPKRSI
jgi:hypothetical protein